jgi:hypothetical protein
MIKEIDKICTEEGLPTIQIIDPDPQLNDDRVRSMSEQLFSFPNSGSMVRGPNTVA